MTSFFKFILFPLTLFQAGSLDKTPAYAGDNIPDGSPTPFWRIKPDPHVIFQKAIEENFSEADDLQRALRELSFRDAWLDFYSRNIEFLRTKIAEEILVSKKEKNSDFSAPFAQTMNVIWTGGPMPKHYVLNLVQEAQNKNQKLIVWGDYSHAPSHWLHEYDWEALRTPKNSTSPILKNIFEDFDSLIQKLKNKTQKIDELFFLFVRSFVLHLFIASRCKEFEWDSQGDFDEESKPSSSETLPCFLFKKERVPEELIEYFQRLQKSGRIEFRTLEDLKIRSKTFLPTFLHQGLWDVIDFEKNGLFPNYAAVSDVARLIALGLGNANQIYVDLDSLNLTPEIEPIINKTQLAKISFANSFLLSGCENSFIKPELSSILLRYNFLKTHDLLQLKKGIFKYIGTMFATGNYGNDHKLIFEDSYHSWPYITLWHDTRNDYKRLNFLEGNWRVKKKTPLSAEAPF
ncbi:MAG: hypothetical protein ACRCUQ_00855 [Alphaproteobacteria bacterium]